ncbi:hypothetical protein BAUCODRAFT_33005 [Baudoinia panamericana UAMH 10762]|uniref:Uncharacterized protein n=1 Tax=Baudoinia panamericana (strain UAMH 10762) TaxID=717646 RepID=M2MKP1_BAUPA|nr:uncharacterized protein BAUCODRAFT_33005 [Baudoinia panamericana UAMH 10762]EMC97261.1 hypothetical protein BAUCODRAFT_33005 [Baudoinia panamericana UAMH 10762]
MPRRIGDYSARFNSIRHYSEQVNDENVPLLQEIGCILIAHEVHESFALTLLHRHDRLDPGFVMVHTITAREDICSIKEFDREHVYDSEIATACGSIIITSSSSVSTDSMASTA